MSDRMSKQLAQRLAEVVAAQIADRLFVNGDGKKAQRLMLISPNGKDLGGWCKQAAIDQILQVLRA